MKVEDCIWYEDEFCGCGCRLETDEMKDCKCSDNMNDEPPIWTIPDNSDGLSM